MYLLLYLSLSSHKFERNKVMSYCKIIYYMYMFDHFKINFIFIV